MVSKKPSIASVSSSLGLLLSMDGHYDGYITFSNEKLEIVPFSHFFSWTYNFGILATRNLLKVTSSILQPDGCLQICHIIPLLAVMYLVNNGSSLLTLLYLINSGRVAGRISLENCRSSLMALATANSLGSPFSAAIHFFFLWMSIVIFSFLLRGISSMSPSFYPLFSSFLALYRSASAWWDSTAWNGFLSAKWAWTFKYSSTYLKHWWRVKGTT